MSPPPPTWHGKNERAWIAWHCEKRNGCCFPPVCAGESHCSADASGPVAYSITAVPLPPTAPTVTDSFRPNSPTSP